MRGTHQVIAVAEFYESLDHLEDEIQVAQRNSWLVVGGSMLLIYVLLSGFVRRASQIIELQRSALNTQVTQLSELLTQNRRLNERVQRAAASVTTINEQNLKRTVSSWLHVARAVHSGQACWSRSWRAVNQHHRSTPMVTSSPVFAWIVTDTGWLNLGKSHFECACEM